MDTGVYSCERTDVRVAFGDGGRMGHICFGPAVAEGNGSVERLSGASTMRLGLGGRIQCWTTVGLG